MPDQIIPPQFFLSHRNTVLNLGRRATLLGLAAGTFVVATRLSSPAFAQAKKYGGDAMEGGLKDDPRVFLSIADDGTVTLLCNRAEMGQGIRTGWAMVVADELEADIARLKVQQAPGRRGSATGNQEHRSGSRSACVYHFDPLRRGAAARAPDAGAGGGVLLFWRCARLPR